MDIRCEEFKVFLIDSYRICCLGESIMICLVHVLHYFSCLWIQKVLSLVDVFEISVDGYCMAKLWQVEQDGTLPHAALGRARVQV